MSPILALVALSLNQNPVANFGGHITFVAGKGPGYQAYGSGDLPTTGSNQQVVLRDGLDDAHAFTAFVPGKMDSSDYIIVRKGSLLSKGHYTAKTAKCLLYVPASGALALVSGASYAQVGDIPLDDEGKLACDVALNYHDAIVLPIDTIDGLTLKEGVAVYFLIKSPVVKDTSISFTASLDSMPSSGTGKGSGTLTYDKFGSIPCWTMMMFKGLGSFVFKTDLSAKEQAVKDGTARTLPMICNDAAGEPVFRLGSIYYSWEPESKS